MTGHRRRKSKHRAMPNERWRLVRPRLQYRLQDDKGGVLVNRLDNPGGARYRGEVVTLGGHGER